MAAAAFGSLVLTFSTQVAWAGTPEYRLYNYNSGEHFYTADADERNHLVHAGWDYEGFAWMNTGKTNRPVYRLLNPHSGEHFYTIKKKEKDSLIKSGWEYEGIDSYAVKKSQVPVFRLYNSKNGRHIYTASVDERTRLARNGWKSEGISWYVDSSAPSYSLTSRNRNYYVTAHVLNVRALPNASSDQTFSYTYGQKVHVAGADKSTGWLKTNAGFISPKYVSDKPVIVKTSMSAKGNKSSSNTGLSHVWNTTASGMSQKSIDAGNLVLWKPDYYAADIRTTCGKQIRALKSGDVISINGRKVMIDGEVYGNYKTDTVESIRAKVGNGPCFQTCIPPYGGSVVVKYGHYL